METPESTVSPYSTTGYYRVNLAVNSLRLWKQKSVWERAAVPMARRERAGFALSRFMLHCNIIYLSARHRTAVIGAGIADKPHLVWDRTWRLMASIAGWHQGLVVR
jgi:hypothetical protein